jgi:hypothetical protein
VFVLLVSVGVATVEAQNDSIPIPRAIRAAYASGTRSPEGRPGSRYWQINPIYEIEAQLLPGEAVVAGTGQIYLENTSGLELRELILRLDQNRFRTDEARARTRGITISRLSIDGDDIPVLDSTVTGLATTVARVALPEPIAPGESTSIGVAWSYEVPEDEEGLSLRQGRWDHSVFQIAQWYPRVAMLDDLGGWDTAEHDGTMEFFNPFASFRVSIEVPVGWLVGASGSLENVEDVLTSSVLSRLHDALMQDTVVTVVHVGEAGNATKVTASGTLVWSFQADSVSDFALGASPDYGWAVTSASPASTRGFWVQTFFTERHREALLNATAETADALARLSDLLTPYPWQSHTLLDGPEGGMEYPALTMSHGDRTLHETGHQWFPMSVGSDETRFNFLDEGLASFLPLLIRGEPLTDLGATPPIPEPILLADDVRSVRVVLGYGRASRMLRVLAADFGGEAVQSALRTYATEWRFKHPSPWDFIATMERSLGKELDAFWLEWLFSSGGIGR